MINDGTMDLVMGLEHSISVRKHNDLGPNRVIILVEIHFVFGVPSTSDTYLNLTDLDDSKPSAGSLVVSSN